MSRKTISIGLFSVFAFVVLLSSGVAYADQYYDQYPGNCFLPGDETASYEKGPVDPYLHHDDTGEGYYYCPVNFNVPDGSTYFIKSIGMRYKDNLTDGYLLVYLYRHNLYTGADHVVAQWNSGMVEANASVQTASEGTNPGYKLVDSKKFVYRLHVYFARNGAVNPGAELKLWQIRIHYGT